VPDRKQFRRKKIRQFLLGQDPRSHKIVPRAPTRKGKSSSRSGPLKKKKEREKSFGLYGRKVKSARLRTVHKKDSAAKSTLSKSPVSRAEPPGRKLGGS